MIYRRTRLNQSTNNVFVAILSGYPQRSSLLVVGFLVNLTNNFKTGVHKELYHIQMLLLAVYCIVQSCHTITVFMPHNSKDLSFCEILLIQDLSYHLNVPALRSYQQDSSPIVSPLFIVYLCSRLDQMLHTLQVFIDVFGLLAAFDSAKKIEAQLSGAEFGVWTFCKYDLQPIIFSLLTNRLKKLFYS